MKTLHWLILLASLAGAGAALGHEASAHPGKHAGEHGAAPAQQPWGIAGRARDATRTIEIGMHDTLRFSPARIELRQGETVRFAVRNTGAAMHEFVIGRRADNEAHAAAMARMPDMQHDEPWMAHVPPGQASEIVWTFNRAGEFDFACLVPGHAEAGMRGTLVVARR